MCELYAVLQKIAIDIFRRMNKFENDLFTTVDNILQLLGHTPSVRQTPITTHLKNTHFHRPPARQNVSSIHVVSYKDKSDNKAVDAAENTINSDKNLKVDTKVTSKKGPRLVKSPTELAKLLDKM